MVDLFALADRVENLTGTDRLVDAEIFKALGMPLPTEFFNRGINLSWDESQQAFVMSIDKMQMRYEHPHFTASLDAAMTLVPEGHAWTLSTLGPVAFPDEDAGHEEATATSPAIALTAACLRARASTDKGEA